MKILHVYKTYYPETKGGVEEFIHQLITGSRIDYNIIDELEMSVLSFYPGKTRNYTYKGYDCYRLSSIGYVASSPISISALFKFYEITSGYDLIHYHFPNPMSDFYHWWTQIKTPYIVTYHCDIIKYKQLAMLYTPLMNWFLSNAKKIVATSPNYLETSKCLKKFKSNCEVIPIGIKEFDSFENKLLTHIKDKYKRYIIFVGVFRYYKGLEYLIKAAKELEINVLLIGDGAYINKLRNQAAELSNVFFLGDISDVEKFHYIKQAQALVMPSCYRTEAFGISLLEGAMLGKPLISCSINSGNSYINVDGETGIEVEPKDVRSLLSAIRMIIDDNELADKFGESASKRYQELFNRELMVEKYYKLYKSILSQNK